MGFIVILWSLSVLWLGVFEAQQFPKAIQKQQHDTNVKDQMWRINESTTAWCFCWNHCGIVWRLPARKKKKPVNLPPTKNTVIFRAETVGRTFTFERIRQAALHEMRENFLLMIWCRGWWVFVDGCRRWGRMEGSGGINNRSMGLGYLPIIFSSHLPEKSAIHVGKYTIHGSYVWAWRWDVFFFSRFKWAI